MITLKNILEEYPKISQSVLPKELKQNEFDFLKNEGMEFYKDDETIKEFVDTFVSELNKIASKQKTKPKPVIKNKSSYKSKEQKAYDLLKKIFSDIKKIDKSYDGENEIYFVQEKESYDKFVVECFYQKTKIGIVLDIAQYYTQNGDLMSAPRIQIAVNNKTEEVFPINYESHNTIPQIYAEHYDWQNEVLNKDRKYKDTLDFILQWFKNLKNQGFGGNLFKTKEVVKKTTSKTKNKVAKKTKSKKREVKTRSVGNVDLQVSIIKSFVLMQGKIKTESSILNLYKRIEKASTELKIRKTSKYAKQIMFVADFLKYSYNDRKFNVQIAEKDFNKLYDIAYSEKQKDSVRLIKRYVGMYGLDDNAKTEKRAENLLKAIKSALSKKKIAKSDMYYDRIKEIESNLEAYLLKNKNLHPNGFDLRGLAGIVGLTVSKKKTLNGLDSPEPKIIPVHNISHSKENTDLPSGVISSIDLKEMDFETINFTGDWNRLIGNPTNPFHIMIYGMGGMGKSTQSVHFAKYIANHHNFKVLYLSKEEGIGNTIKEKFERLNAFHENIYIVSEMPSDLSFFDLLIIDSVNEMNMSPDDLRNIQETYPNLSTWQIFKVTKTGEFLGKSDFKHLCQVELVCEDGYCHSVKNRFGATDWVEIKNFTFNRKDDFKLIEK